MYSAHEVETFKKAYNLLNISPSSTPEEIKKQYRVLCKQWHPDRWISQPDKQQEANHMMRAINASYDLIENAPLQHRNISDEPIYRAETNTRATAQTRDDNMYARSYRRNAARRRYNNVQEATYARRRSAARFRFAFGAVCGLGPCFYLYTQGVRGEVLLLWTILFALIFGFAYKFRNVLED